MSDKGNCFATEPSASATLHVPWDVIGLLRSSLVSSRNRHGRGIGRNGFGRPYRVAVQSLGLPHHDETQSGGLEELGGHAPDVVGRYRFDPDVAFGHKAGRQAVHLQ